jgi:hypothetical protein
MSKLTKLINHPVRFFVDSKLFGGTKTKKTVKSMPNNIIKATKGPKKQILNRPLGMVLANPKLRETRVAVYFSATNTSYYQLAQWFKVFSKLEEEFGLCVIVRDMPVFEKLRDNTKFPVVICIKLEELIGFYESHHFSAILYVNNSAKNFQSLIWHKSYHVHINHGESEKASMFSNQVKAYDYVFVVGQAAKNRYVKNLKKFDANKLIQVGRPQLDNIQSYALKSDSNRPVVIYAPTWEATYESMNYSSVADHGVNLATQIMESGQYYFIYRPHPSIGNFCTKTAKEHNIIMDLVEQNEHAVCEMNEDINSLFKSVDIAIFDNSSVAIDFLTIDKPMLMTNYFGRDSSYNEPNNIPKFVEACYLINSDNIGGIIELLDNEVKHDTKSSERGIIKDYYLGSFDEGESTMKFISTLESIMNE